MTTQAEARARLEILCAVDLEPPLSAAEVDRLLNMSRRSDSSGRYPDDVGWESTFDLRWAAAEGWRWKAGKCAQYFDFSADGASINKQQIMENCQKMSKFYAAASADTIQALSAVGLDSAAHGEQVP